MSKTLSYVEVWRVEAPRRVAGLRRVGLRSVRGWLSIQVFVELTFSASRLAKEAPTCQMIVCMRSDVFCAYQQG